MKQWRCVICGYIHVGNTPPEKCPVCGAGSEHFELIADSTSVNDQNIKINQTSITERAALQEVLFQIPCGLLIISTVANGKYNGMINNTVFQITDQPLQLLLGMDKLHLTTELISQSQKFAVMFLRSDQIQLVKQFGFKSGREIEKFNGLAWHLGTTGVPILDDVAGYLECTIQTGKVLDTGTHMVFLAQVVSGMIQPGNQSLLTYQEYRKRKSELWNQKNG